MNNLSLFIFLIGASLLGHAQAFDSNYAVFDRKVVLVKGVKESSELVCVVPKGDPVRIVERVGGPFYKAQYKDWKGYLISFNLNDRFKSSRQNARQEPQRIPTPEKLFVKVSKKTYIVKKKDNRKDYKMMITVPKHERLEILRRVKKGKYLVRYKSHVGVCDLSSNNVKDDVEVAFLERMEIQKMKKAHTTPMELVITEYKVLEVRKEEANKGIDLNEMLDLKFTIKNKGDYAADLNIKVSSEQEGVRILGKIEGADVLIRNPGSQLILPGDYQTLTYRYYLTSAFNNKELHLKVSAIDRVYGNEFNGEMIFPVQGGLKFEDWKSQELLSRKSWETDHRLEADSFYKDRGVTDRSRIQIENVDLGIPVTNRTQKKTYALVIGNEDYRSRQTSLATEQNAEFAINDAEVFAAYCERTLGIPRKQIKILRNATAAEISQGLAWISNLSKIEKGDADLIFFYSGHGLPSEEARSPVLLPVDVSSNNVRYGVPLSDAYQALVEHPARQVTVFLDACFSGAGKNHGLLPSKGIKVMANKDAILENMVVFSSSSGSETSSVYREAHHGYFTYFLLKKLKESKGNVKYEELGSYLIRSVQKETGLNGIVQTPEVNASPKVADQWQNWKLK